MVQIDHQHAHGERLGVAVINAPAGNTVAVAELFYGTVIGLLQALFDRDFRFHEPPRVG